MDGERVDVVVVGSVNFDLTLQTPRLPRPGESIAARGSHAGPGGKGLNQAIAAARQGASAALVACIGADAPGDEMLATLVTEGVDVDGVARLESVPSGLASVIVTDDAENAIVVALGANDALTEDHVHRHGRAIGDAKVLLVQLEIPPDAVRAALEIARGTATLAILNAAPPRPVADDVLRLADVVVANEGEAAALTGGSIGGDGEADWPERAARALVARGCTAAIVTVGARGAWYADQRRRLYIPPHTVDAVDTTGAGDAFCGALAAALAAGRSMPEALVRASAAGALTATLPGTAPSLPTALAVDELLTAT
ncbi:MAG TPA: ribokinase [Acidimicrobiia bacterium]|nr:ribokinase [Acidimicrobiia bacterium]